MNATFGSLSSSARFALAILIAVTAVVGLQRWLTRRADAAVPAVPVAGPDERALPASFPRGRPLLVYLVGPDGAVPARAAPVVSIPGGGAAVRIERGPPPPAGPGSAAEPWLAAAVRLPVRDLEDLAAIDRAWLAEVLRAFGVVGRLPHGELLAVALRAPRSATDRLCRWIR